MQKFFDKYPEFIESDTRTNRTNPLDGYLVTADFLTKRFECIMPIERCAGKRILDLGSCTASMGAWCLSHGAASYTGVELQTEFAKTSKINLSKYFKGNWSIIESSVDEYLETCTAKFDIIVASGVVYGMEDLYRCLKLMTQITDYVVIESRHPYILSTKAKKFPNTSVIKQIELEQAIFEIVSNIMVSEISGHTLSALGFLPSIGALSSIFNSLDFVTDLSVYDNLKAQLGEIYGLNNHDYARYGAARYGVGFFRSKEINASKPFADVYRSPDLFKTALKKYR